MQYGRSWLGAASTGVLATLLLLLRHCGDPVPKQAESPPGDQPAVESDESKVSPPELGEGIAPFRPDIERGMKVDELQMEGKTPWPSWWR